MCVCWLSTRTNRQCWLVIMSITLPEPVTLGWCISCVLTVFPGCTIRSGLHQLRACIRNPGQGGLLRRGLQVMVLSYQLVVLCMHRVFVKNRTLKAQGMPLLARLSFISGRIRHVLPRITDRVRPMRTKDTR